VFLPFTLEYKHLKRQEGRVTGMYFVSYL
jgi:hypothetical protein